MTELETNDTAEYQEIAATESENPAAPKRLRLFWIAAIVIILDQFSKLIIESTLPLYQSWAPIPALASFFRISHVSNTGMAFGLFPAGSSIFAWTPVLVSIAIIVYNYFLPAGQKGLRLALAFQLGGALGNWIDRMRLGHVTDFLDFGPWPVFNLADFSVVSGAILLAWIFWQEEREQKAAEASLLEPSQAEESSSERIDRPAMIDEWSAN